MGFGHRPDFHRHCCSWCWHFTLISSMTPVKITPIHSFKLVSPGIAKSILLPSFGAHATRCGMPWGNLFAEQELKEFLPAMAMDVETFIKLSNATGSALDRAWQCCGASIRVYRRKNYPFGCLHEIIGSCACVRDELLIRDVFNCVFHNRVSVASRYVDF